MNLYNSTNLFERKKMSSTAEQLKKILEELNEEKLNELSDEKVLELRKQLNPYGRIIEGSDKYLTFSYTDLRESFLKKFLITSLVGFLNRMNAEWEVPDGIPVVHPYDYAQGTETLQEPETYKDPLAKADAKANLEHMKKRIVVQEFLEHLFQFDPDEHVRSAHRPAPEDPERKPIKTPAAKRAVAHLMKTDKKFKAAKEKRDTLAKLKVPEAEEKTVQKEKEKSDVERHTTEMIPPDDTFGRFTRYMEANYDKLREVTQDLYCVKPDLDRAICPHAMHDTRDEADKYINKHKDEMIAEVHVAHTGKWNFFAPFEKVRDSTRYFNSQTIVLEEMVKQIELDSKLGADLMKKRIAKKKKKNVEQVGEDAPGFAKWKAQNSTLKDMGVIENPNNPSYADDECPDSGVQVDVFSFSKGGQEMSKTRFYTEAEKPVISAPDEQGSGKSDRGVKVIAPPSEVKQE